MNYLIPANQLKERNSATAEIVVGHLIKGFLLNETKTYRSNVFWELKIKESEDLCSKAENLAQSLGYSLSFSQFRGSTVACFDAKEVLY